MHVASLPPRRGAVVNNEYKVTLITQSIGRGTTHLGTCPPKRPRYLKYLTTQRCCLFATENANDCSFMLHLAFCVAQVFVATLNACVLHRAGGPNRPSHALP